MIFVLMVMVVVVVAALWNFDLNKILYVKSKARNAGDSAALAGARWQGVTLNTIGQINLMQALALTDALSRGQTDFTAIEAMGDLGARVAFVGPMTGVVAAQQAAKNNGIFGNERFATNLENRANFIRSEYHLSYNEPYPSLLGSGSTWDDYADMYDAIASEDVAVQIENPKYYDGLDYGDHMLLNPAFYDAISSSDWCWFLHNAMDLLQDYNNFRDWPPIPTVSLGEPVNAELLSCGVRRIRMLDDLPLNQPAMLELMQTIGVLGGIDPPPPPEVAEIDITWYAYNRRMWGAWSSTVDASFPWEGNIRPQYDYMGADAAVRLESDLERLTPSSATVPVNWTSAAKPFGTLPGPVRPDQYGLILPAYQEVRLIPIDTSSAPAGGSRPGWSEFVTNILPIYMQLGPNAVPSSNWYAQQLITWENALFRRGGLAWIQANSAQCHIPPSPGGGGGGGGGGSYHGH